MHMGIDTRADVWIGIGVCIDMRADMRTDMCTDLVCKELDRERAGREKSLAAVRLAAYSRCFVVCTTKGLVNDACHGI